MRTAIALLLALPLSALAAEVTTPVIAPAAYGVTSAVIASNGRTFLRLFHMNGITYASATGLDGRPRTEMPFAVSDLEITSLVWTGSEYAALSNVGTNVALLRFAEDGTPIAQTTFPFALFNTRLAWNGRNLLLAGIEPPTQRLGAHLLAVDGTEIGSIDPNLPPGIFSDGLAAVDGDFILASSTVHQLNVQRIRGTAVELLLSEALANVDAGVLNLLARRESIVVQLRTSLVILAAAAPPRHDNVAPGAKIITTASGYAVVRPVPLTATSDVVRLDATGHMADASVLQLVQGTLFGGAAAGDLVQLLDGEFGVNGTNLVATSLRVDVAPVNTTREVVSLLPHRQIRQSVASDGVGFLALFDDLTADTSSVTFARVRRGAMPLDGPGIVAGDPGPFRGTAVVGAPGGYLAVWSAPDALNGAFIGSDGAVGPPFTVVQHIAVNDPAIASNGSVFLAVWSNGQRVFGAPVYRFGGSGPVRQLSPDDPLNVHVSPDVAWDGRQFVVTWMSVSAIFPCGISPCVPGPPNGVTVEHVAIDGMPVEAHPLPVITNLFTGLGGAHVASAGDGTALVVIDSTRLAAARVHDGTVDPPRALFEWFGNFALRSDVAFDGSAYVIAWRFAARSSSFLASGRLPANGSGALVDTRVIAVGPPPLEPAIAVSSLETAIAVAEVASPAAAARIHAYFTADMAPMPPPPAPPREVAQSVLDNVLQVRWAAEDDAKGFAILSATDGGVLGTAPAGSTHATIPFRFAGIVQVRAYDAGGLSAPATATVIRPAQRRVQHR